MSAIKKFFTDEHTRKRRLEEVFLREQRAIENNVYVVDQKKLDDAYETLKQWRLISEEDLLYYYQTLDQEQYEYVVSKKNDFPSEVRDILWGPPPLYDSSTKCKLTVVDYSDKMYLDRKLSDQRELEKKIEELMAGREIPTRPIDEIDDNLSQLHATLQTQEQRLEALMKGPTKKYVAPSMRKQFMLSDPAVQDLMKQIEKTKNEITVCEKSVVKANNDWADVQRFELRQEILTEMYAL